MVCHLANGSEGRVHMVTAMSPSLISRFLSWLEWRSDKRARPCILGAFLQTCLFVLVFLSYLAN